MEVSQDLVTLIALTLGLGWASGINLYAAIFMLGYLSLSGQMVLPPGLEVLAEPQVMWAAGFMYCVEFFADKTPGVDTAWDAIHGFIRIPAGVVLAAAAMSDVGMSAQIAAGLIGGSLASGSYLTKAGGRVLINTSPEPVSNWVASVAEDIIVIVGLWTALSHPGLFLILMLLMVVLFIWLLPKIWRGITKVFITIKKWLGFNVQQQEDLNAISLSSQNDKDKGSS